MANLWESRRKIKDFDSILDVVKKTKENVAEDGKTVVNLPLQAASVEVLRGLERVESKLNQAKGHQVKMTGENLQEETETQVNDTDSQTNNTNL